MKKKTKQKKRKKKMSKHELPMNTSTAINVLTNANLKQNAVIAHICNGGPMAEPSLISPMAIDPDPNISDDLAAQITEMEDQVQTIYDWALTH